MMSQSPTVPAQAHTTPHTAAFRQPFLWLPAPSTAPAVNQHLRDGVHCWCCSIDTAHHRTTSTRDGGSVLFLLIPILYFSIQPILISILKKNTDI